MNRLIYLIFIPLLLTLSVSCSRLGLDNVLPDKRTTYQKSRNLPALEVPPDLTTGAINDSMAIPGEEDATTLSKFEQQKGRRAATAGGAVVIGSGEFEDEQWLTVIGSSFEVWPKLSEFWIAKGYKLDLDDAELGVMETDWLETSSGVRHKFKIFSEPGQGENTLVLFLSSDREEKSDGEWTVALNDVELEKVMIAELNMHFYGAAVSSSSSGTGSTSSSTSSAAAPIASAAQKKQAEILSTGEGKSYLAIPEEFTRAWRDTGTILERAGYLVEGSDQEKGLYQILYIPPEGQEDEEKGLLSKLKFWGDDEPKYKPYVVSLTGVGDKTELIVMNEDNEWEDSDNANLILDTIKNLYNR